MSTNLPGLTQRLLHSFFVLLLIGLSISVQADTGSASQPAASSQLLADLLENPETRDQLIRELRALATAEEGASDSEQLTLVQQVADTTQAFAQQLTTQILNALDAISTLGQTEWHLLVPHALNFLYVIIATLAS